MDIRQQEDSVVKRLEELAGIEMSDCPKRQILMPTDDMDFPYVDDHPEARIWHTNNMYPEDEDYYGTECTSCGKPHGEDEVFIREESKQVLCSNCVVIVTRDDMLNAWKEKHNMGDRKEQNEEKS